MNSTPPPSMQRRLARVLVGWSLLWSLGVAGAVWLAARHEVNELLDDTLRASADVLATLIARHPLELSGAEPVPAPRPPSGRFAWQLVGADGGLLARSAAAPPAPFVLQPRPGHRRVPGWRLYTTQIAGSTHWLHVAQTNAERREALLELTISAVAAAVLIGAIGHLVLRWQLRRELRPLQRLSQRLSEHDPFAQSSNPHAGGDAGDLASRLGAPEREELAPVHAAIARLQQRLARRLASERAFSAHIAHALRTPLAGIDTQLAVALREAAADLQPRLRSVREAAARLQQVVVALLGLFRSGADLRREPIDLVQLLATLPAPGLQVELSPDVEIEADPDLLSAALLNLLDNAVRHGARHLWLDSPAPGRLRLRDDGTGMSEARRVQLQGALDQQQYDSIAGLGLSLAGLVARSHGGRVELPPAAAGCTIVLDLRDPNSDAAGPPAGHPSQHDTSPVP